MIHNRNFVIQFLRFYKQLFQSKNKITRYQATVRAYCRHWRYGCVFLRRIFLGEKGYFVFLHPLKRCHFYPFIMKFKKKTQSTRLRAVVAPNIGLEQVRPACVNNDCYKCLRLKRWYRIHNTEKTEKDGKHFSQWIENEDLYKPVLNKLMITREYCIQCNFEAPLTPVQLE